MIMTQGARADFLRSLRMSRRAAPVSSVLNQKVENETVLVDSAP